MSDRDIRNLACDHDPQLLTKVIEVRIERLLLRSSHDLCQFDAVAVETRGGKVCQLQIVFALVHVAGILPSELCAYGFLAHL